MLEQVLRTIRRHAMMNTGHVVAVAVSGGADSVCLLLILGELASQLGITLSAIHVNHGLRSRESDADEEFVRNLCLQCGVPLHVERIQLPARENLEQAARDARRRVFAQIDANRIATAHTRSDQAETVLYRLLRGAGIAGLSGILPVTAERIVRPLLDCSRPDVERYLLDRGQTWREDRTNADPAFTRNRIRHELIPLLAREYNPAVSDILSATARLAHDEENYWRAEMDSLASRLFTCRSEAVVLHVDDVRSLHPAVRRRLLRRAIADVKGDLRGIDLLHVERILGLAEQVDGSGRTQAPGIDAFRSFEWLRIARQQTRSRFERDYRFVVPMGAARSEFRLKDSRIFLEIQPDVTNSYTEGGDDLDHSRLVGPLELRNWHPGDEFQPPGRSRQKIKTLFHEARVPLWERHGWPVLTCSGDIVWTRTFGVAEGFLPVQSTRTVLRIYELEAVECAGSGEVSDPPDDSRESKQPV